MVGKSSINKNYSQSLINLSKEMDILSERMDKENLVKVSI